MLIKSGSMQFKRENYCCHNDCYSIERIRVKIDYHLDTILKPRVQSLMAKDEVEE